MLGSIVKSKFGHDSGSFYLVVKEESSRFYLADGRCRKLEKPKCKNRKHFEKTGMVVDLNHFDTNKKIRRVLWVFNFSHDPVADKGRFSACQKKT